MENDTDPLRLLTLQEAAHVLRINKRTVLLMARRKEFPAFKLGGQWRIRESELAKWLDDLEEL